MEQTATAFESASEAVCVRLGAGDVAARLALPMDVVAEVGRPPGLTRVPGLPSWVAGVANWRGRVLAVVDLGPLLGTASPAASRRARLVVLSRDGVSVGLLVGAVEGTVQVDPDAVAPVLAHLPGPAGALLLGHLTDAEGPLGLLDVAALFALPDALPRPRRG